MSAPRAASSTVRSDDAEGMRRSQMLDAIVAGQAQIVRQQEQIRSMNDENEQLKKEIVHVSGTQYDYVKADKLATLQGDVDALERRYQFEKMRKNDLTKRYQLARIDLLQSRRMKGGVNVEKEQAEAVQRQVDILENRLDQALGKFNDALSFNKELRDRIDIIREERRVFQRVHRRMEDDLRAKKLLIAERIEQSNKDMDERDGYVRQAEQLQAALAEQQREYQEQLRAMDAAMVDIKTMREEQANMQLELEAREYEFENQLANRSFAAGAGGGLAHTTSTTNSGNNNNNTTRTVSAADATLTGSSALAATVAGGATTTSTATTQPPPAQSGARQSHTLSRRADELGDEGGNTYNNVGFGFHDDGDGSANAASAHAHDSEQESHSIIDVVARIRDALHSDDLDALLREYETLGDGNFSLYKYLNELTVTREGLADEMRDLQQLLQEEHDSDVRQRRLIKSLEEQLARTESQLAEVQRSMAGYEDTIANVMRLTREVHKRIGCASHKKSDAAMADANAAAACARNVGKTSYNNNDDDDEAAAAGVCDEATLMAYLGDIEERANYVVCAYLQWQQKQQQQQQAAQQRYRGAPGRGAPTAAAAAVAAAAWTTNTPPYNDDSADNSNNVSASRTLAGGGGTSPHIAQRQHSAAAAADDSNDRDDGPYNNSSMGDGDGDDTGRRTKDGDALASQASTTRGTLPPELSADNMDMDAIPLLPLAPRMVHNAVSAQRLVRQVDLPSASLGVADTGNALLGGERDDDHVVSHDEIRRQLEARYLFHREQQQQQQQQQSSSSAVATAARRRHNKETNSSNSSGHGYGTTAAATAAAAARPWPSAALLPRTR